MLSRELGAQQVELAHLQRAVQRLSADARLQSSQAADLHGASLFVLARKMAGELESSRRKEELEAMQAALRLMEAREAVQACQHRIDHLSSKLARGGNADALRQDLATRKAVLLKVAGDPGLVDLEPLVETMGKALAVRRHLNQASARVAECRGALDHLMRKTPRGPFAGKYDILDDGILGWVATRAKYRHLDDYNGDVMALRDLLRDLDASPVVDVTDLIEAVPLSEVGPDMRSLDHLTEFIGPDALVDVSVAFLTRRHMEALRFVDAKLSVLQDRLAARLAVAEAEVRAIQEAQRALIERL